MNDMTTNTSDEILGWHVRIPASQVQALWDAERREAYLLIPKTKFPLSVDKRVWPLANLPVIAERVFEDFAAGPNEAPNGLDVFQLRKDVIQKDLWASGEYKIVGIGMQRDVAMRFREKNSIVSLTATEIPATMQCLLGFDVCDRWLLSGLMNCGLEAAAQKKLRDTYAASLNAYGLFDRAEIAAAFAGEINHLAPEHAPFVPASLFTLGEPELRV